MKVQHFKQTAIVSFRKYLLYNDDTSYIDTEIAIVSFRKYLLYNVSSEKG